MRRDSRLVALLALAGSGVLLGGFLVPKVQAYIVYERLFTGAEFREPTVIEAPFVWSGVATLITGVALSFVLARRSVRVEWGSALARSLYVLVAFAIWWALAVAQWWLIVGPWAPPETVRDPTPLDTLLLVGIGVAAVGTGVAALHEWQNRRRRLGGLRVDTAQHAGRGGGHDSEGPWVPASRDAD